MSKIIINSEELSNIFQEKCKNYNHIAFVTAWAGNPNEKSIQCLFNNRYKITKAVVGLHCRCYWHLRSGVQVHRAADSEETKESPGRTGCIPASHDGKDRRNRERNRGPENGHRGGIQRRRIPPA